MVLERIIGNGNGQKPGSVGAFWPPAFDPHNNRIKGFSTSIITSHEKLQNTFREVSTVEKTNPNATRSTFRAFVRSGLIEGIRNDKSLEYPVEAVIPANNCVEGCGVVYFGRNKSERLPGQDLATGEQESLNRVQQVAKVCEEKAVARLTASGYHISVLNGNKTDSDINTLLSLYRDAYQVYTFDINEITINTMIGNGNYVVVGRNAQNLITSALVAEHCEITLDNGQKVSLYELSDYATFKKDRGHGLITAMQFEAMKHIRSLADGAKAVIYAEGRAPWEAANLSIKKAGMEFGGTLPFACSILSDRSVVYTGDYESLNVWYSLS